MHQNSPHLARLFFEVWVWPRVHIAVKNGSLGPMVSLLSVEREFSPEDLTAGTWGYTLQETNISHLWKRKIIFKKPCLGDMLYTSLEGTSGRGKSSEPSHQIQVPAVNLRGCKGNTICKFEGYRLPPAEVREAGLYPSVVKLMFFLNRYPPGN